MTETPGHLDRVLHRQEQAQAGALVGLHLGSGAYGDEEGDSHQTGPEEFGLLPA